MVNPDEPATVNELKAHFEISNHLKEE